jgi:hypothetical protein
MSAQVVRHRALRIHLLLLQAHMVVLVRMAR